MSNDDGSQTEKILLEAEQRFCKWIEDRRQTIAELRLIAEYIESVLKKTTIAKAVGSGSGIVAGGLTLVGGALTIAATGGLAAVPILIGKITMFFRQLKVQFFSFQLVRESVWRPV